MINRIHLENFRRHAELDLAFDDDRQIVLIAGRNGVGKSTVLEAITFALYGEGRHGRRNLDTLLRRGAELEGLTVELEFTVGADRYRVRRRRDGKASTAVLYANDNPLVEGPVQVTDEIEKVLGMDAAGFRLAVIAQQKDIDGLASLRPAERAQMITRLLRLDVLTAAKEEAGVLFRKERDTANALRGAQDFTGLQDDLSAALAEEAVASTERQRAVDAVAALQDTVNEYAAEEAAWERARTEMSRLEAVVAGHRAEVDRLTAELDAVVVPAAAAVAHDLEHLAAEIADVESRIAVGEQQSRLAEQRVMIEGEVAQIATERARLETLLLSNADVDIDALDTELVALSARETELAATVEALRTDLADARAHAGAISARLERLDTLGATCETCGQTVDETHREAEHAAASAALVDAQALADRVLGAGRDATAELDDVRARVATIRESVRQATSAAEQRQLLLAQLDELDRRHQTFSEQLTRLEVDPVDLDALYARKAELAVVVGEANAQAEASRRREQAEIRRSELTGALDAARERLTAAEAAVVAATPDDDSRRRHEEFEQARADLDGELEILAHWDRQVAVLAERVAGASNALDRAKVTEQRREAHQRQAVHAAAAQRLLGDVADRLATQIRPALEGAVSALLATMSEGRFTSVQIDPEYNINVVDDGAARPLSELSGGEVDLVALATRLALAQVVADRHGAGGAGFLILDECFGSQDPVRRASILTALRSLRSTYSQIFLISHVENIEDAADVVIEISATEDRSETSVVVA